MSIKTSLIKIVTYSSYLMTQILILFFLKRMVLPYGLLIK